MSKRLNYKECRENVFKLIDKSSTISKQEIWKVIGLGDNMDYVYDYWRFPAFLKHTRRYATKEYFKAKKEMVSISNIFTLKSILDKNKFFISKFLQFCEIERIPLLYYVHQIKKYIFPSEQLLLLIYGRLYVISIKGLISSLKGSEIFGMYKNNNEIISFISQAFKECNKENKTSQYLISFIRKNYIFGEEKEVMFKRLDYTNRLKKLNDEIENNLSSIDLKLIG